MGEYFFRFVALSLFLAYVHAATFKVISPESTTVEVSVNGQRTVLTASDPTLPYFVGDAVASPGAKYKYVADGKEEPFDRVLEGDATYNEFYGRPVTYSNIAPFPQAINDENWTRGGSISKGSIWDDNYIPSIFVTADSEKVTNLVENVPKEKFPATITFIGLDSVQTFEGCNFGLHAPGKKHNNAKQSWEWALPEGQYIENRNWIKLRHMEEDPTQIREKLYTDTLASMGSYANRANMIRFFINGRGYGTFNMLDDIPQYSYIRAAFYDGNPPNQMGALYDGASGADFGYSTDTAHYDSWIPNKDSPETQEAIAPLCEALENLDPSDDAAVDKFSEMFDVKQFLRFMVMEYLAGHWDGYWMEQTNDGAYHDPTDSKWYYLGQDFDGTFGVNLGEEKSFVSVPYTEYPSRYPNAFMINKLLQNEKTKALFESYLKDTVSNVFNNDVMTERVLKYSEFIRPDVEWDRGIDQLSPGINYGWTFQQTQDNLRVGVDAPNHNGGGANQWGLIEWISAKSNAVAEQYGLSVAKTARTETKVTPAAKVTTSNGSDDSHLTHNKVMLAQDVKAAAASRQGSQSALSLMLAIIGALFTL